MKSIIFAALMGAAVSLPALNLNNNKAEQGSYTFQSQEVTEPAQMCVPDSLSGALDCPAGTTEQTVMITFYVFLGCTPISSQSNGSLGGSSDEICYY